MKDEELARRAWHMATTVNLIMTEALAISKGKKERSHDGCTDIEREAERLDGGDAVYVRQDEPAYK